LAKKGLSLFGVCLFLGVRNSPQNKKNRKKGARKKIMEGMDGPDPLTMIKAEEHRAQQTC